jgi:tRNA threonylcarbamoyladenosine biosynthesis protein TsaB
MTKLLAIDTSTEIASLALKIGEEFLYREQSNQKTHAQLLLPMIDQLMVDSGLKLKQLDGIIFGCGPGSFTGLRISCSIAKGLAFAHDLDLIPISSLAAIAWKAREVQNDEALPVLAVLDARMNELYWGYFAKGELFAEIKVSPASTIQLPENQPIILAGVGIEHYWKDFPESIKSQVITQRSIVPNAEVMIHLAQQASVKPVSAAEAQPMYVRNQVTQGAPRG